MIAPLRVIRPLLLLGGVLAACPNLLWGHDIPNARVDRSIQATLEPGRLRIDYEVSLSELTLTQDLRSLVGTLPGADRAQWFERYGEVTGPLNARGFLISVDGTPLELEFRGFDLIVEDHPRFTFRLECDLPPQGRLGIQDTNYVASEGTSRLAVRGVGGVSIQGDDLPSDVESIPIRPVWMLGDEEESRTRKVVVDFAAPRETPVASTPLAPTTSDATPAAPVPPDGRLSGLLDRMAGLPSYLAVLMAFGLGAIHALQPGHGKTLVAATVVGERGAWWSGLLIALTATLTHTGSVALIAAGLWLSRSARYAEIDRLLVQISGFVIAAIGLWRAGRHIAGFEVHPDHGHEGSLGGRGIVTLGLAAGVVPCWDAIGLIVVAEAVGRLGLGLVLLLVFSLGMASVLIAVGWMTGRIRKVLTRGREASVWDRRLGLISGLLLATIGVALFEGA